jgi:hypothetical protein
MGVELGEYVIRVSSKNVIISIVLETLNLLDDSLIHS